MDTEDSNCPGEKSALDVDIATVNEVQFAEQGSLTEQGAGYTLFWFGKAREETLAAI